MLKILLIEDELIIATDIKISLEADNFASVRIAKNYKEVKQNFQNKMYDLIISDIQLNDEKDGIEIIDELCLLKKIPVIYLTAFSDDETIKRLEKTRPYAYLLKPYNINQLKASINLAIQNFSEKNENVAIDEDILRKIDQLTSREKEVLATLSTGKLSKEIAETLNISINTVEQHKKNIKKKLLLNTIGELVGFAMQTGLTEHKRPGDYL